MLEWRGEVLVGEYREVNKLFWEGGNSYIEGMIFELSFEE